MGWAENASVQAASRLTVPLYIVTFRSFTGRWHKTKALPVEIRFSFFLNTYRIPSYLVIRSSISRFHHHPQSKMGLFSRANDALTVNPTSGANIAITTHGSDWYWAVTAVMALSTFIFLGMSFTVPRRNRVFHYITASITLVASIAYFSMASNLGYTGILVEFTSHLDGTVREIFYVRYIDWVITTPVSLLLSVKIAVTTNSLIASTAGSPPDGWSAMAYNFIYSASR